MSIFCYVVWVHITFHVQWTVFSLLFRPLGSEPGFERRSLLLLNTVVLTNSNKLLEMHVKVLM